MTNRTVTVLADSRGLDTYYINTRYSAAYGVDAVFAYQMNQGDFKSYLVPGHFRAGTIENNILRVALTEPTDVILCDGIWETLLNRQKFFDEAAALGALDPALFKSTNDQDRELAGSVLTDLFLTGQLSVSPHLYSERLDQLVSYFIRRRRTVSWLSLLVPDDTYISKTYHAGNYRPLPGWGNCLTAINDAARTVMEDWGAFYIDLHPIASRLSSAPLIDLWHFSRDMHAAVADCMLERLELASPTRGSGDVFRAVTTPKPVRSHQIFAADLADMQSLQRYFSNCEVMPQFDEDAEAIVVVDDQLDGHRTRARELLTKIPMGCNVLYLSELSEPVPMDKPSNHST